MPMHIPFLSALTSYLQGDGAVILPEIELTLFGLGILLIDFTLGVKERYLNAGLALVGTLFSAYTVWKLRVPVAANGSMLGFHESVTVDPFFLFFASLFLAATALVIPLREIPRNRTGAGRRILRAAAVRLCRHDVHGLGLRPHRYVPGPRDHGAQLLRSHWLLAPRKAFERSLAEIRFAGCIQLRDSRLRLFASLWPERLHEH